MSQMAFIGANKRKPPKFYVSTTGNDSTGNGLTAATAVRNPAKINTLSPGPVAGDIITIGPGTYTNGGGASNGCWAITKGGSSATAMVTYLCERRWSAKITSSGTQSTSSLDSSQVQIGDSGQVTQFVKIKNLEFDYTTSVGNEYHYQIAVGASNNTIEACWFHGWCATQAQWDAQFVRFPGDSFGAYIGPYSWYNNVFNTQITNCIFENSGIKDNRSQHTFHGIYNAGASSGGSTSVSGTVMTNCLLSNLAGQNFTSYNTITALTVQNCTFYNSGNYTSPPGDSLGEAVVLYNDTARTPTSFSNCIVRNTVFHTCGRSIGENNGSTGNVYSYNTFWLTGGLVTSSGTAGSTSNNLTSDPWVVNSSAGDFHIDVNPPAGSAKNTGTPTGAPYYDIDYNVRSSTAPSRGCYE